MYIVKVKGIIFYKKYKCINHKLCTDCNYIILVLKDETQILIPQNKTIIIDKEFIRLCKEKGNGTK